MIQFGGELQHNENAPLHAMPAVLAAAHELKSPLVLMRQLAFTAQDDALPEYERARALHQLTLVADRGLRLTSDLTRTARLEDALLEVEPINAQQLCEMIVHELQPLYQQYGRTLSFSSRRARPLVLAHRELLSSVVYHFADNALHYGDETGPVTLNVSLNEAKRTLRIGVRDHGPAVAKKEWRTATKKATGIATRPHASGLGLQIAEQFSQAMGGTIGLTRHRDGATFYVELPISEQLSLL